MSDLYLHLRHRLDEVRKWVYLGTDVMKGARDAKGWSYETAARAIHVSSKTYERYEKAGRVPVDQLFPTARALDIEIERAARESVDLRELMRVEEQDGALSEILATVLELREEMSELRVAVRGIEELLPPAQDQPASDVPA